MGWQSGYLVVIGLLLGAAGAAASGSCSAYRTDSVFVGSSIGLQYDASAPEVEGLLSQAIAMWGACHNYGVGFPEFLLGRSGTRTVSVEILPEVAGEGLCGSFGQEKITIYGYQRVGGELFSCGNLVQNLAHELGHALGLSEAGTAQRCQLHVMSWITADNGYRRAVQPTECMAAGQRWLTFDELGTVRASSELKVAALTVGR